MGGRPAAEIHDDVLRLTHLGNSEPEITPQSVHRSSYRFSPDPVIHEPSPCYGGLFPPFRGKTFLGQAIGKFTGILAGGLGSHHGEVALKVTVAFVRTGSDPGLGRKIREILNRPGGNSLLQFNPQGH